MSCDILELIDRSQKDLRLLEDSFAATGFDWDRVDAYCQSAHPSTLTVPDLMTALLVGTVGGLMASSEAVRKYCDAVHQDSSKSSPSSRLGKLLSHKGDNIDQFPLADGLKKFITREGAQCSPRFHRIMFGHDPFSTSGDNPFVLLTNQHGLAKGTVQTFRHLFADTFSKQGLPLPFHSYLDYSTESGLNNYLAKWATEISNGTSLSPPEAFGQLFGIRAQDATATVATVLFAKAYFTLMGITDEIRRCQFKLIAYSTTFVTGSLRVYARTGVPGINWPCVPLLLKEIWSFFRLNYRDIHELEKMTSELVARNVSVEAVVFDTGKDLPSLPSGMGYCTELSRGEANFRRLF